MVIWLCHEFMTPPIEKLRLALALHGTISQIQKLPTNLDVLKALLYAIKERGNPTLQNVCQQFTQWPTNINVWANHQEPSPWWNVLLNAIYEQDAFLTNENYMQFPTARRHNDNTISQLCSAS